MKKLFFQIFAVILGLIFYWFIFQENVLTQPRNTEIKTKVIFGEPTLFERDLSKWEKIEESLLSKSFPEVSFYYVISGVSKPPVYYIVAVYNEAGYFLPDQFNRLLLDVNLQITDSNLINLAKAFILVSRPDDFAKVSFQEVERINKKMKDGHTYQVQLNTWSKLNGVTDRWLFSVKNGQFWVVKRIITGMYIGDYEKDEENPAPPVGGIKGYLPEVIEDEGAKEKGKVGEKIEIDGANSNTTVEDGTHYYLIISRNGTGTNRKVRFNLSNFSPNEANVYIRVRSINDSTYTANFLLQPIPIDGSGNGSYDWTPTANSPTGICHVTAGNAAPGDPAGTYVPETNVIELTLEKIITRQFPDPPDSLTVYYTHQFFANHPNSETHAPIFAAYVDTAAYEAWDYQVKQMELSKGSPDNKPLDGDKNHQLFVNDNLNWYHGSIDNEAFGGGERKIGIRYNSHFSTKTDSSYSDEKIRVKVAVTHEFYHGVQWGLTTSTKWGSSAWSWFTEGQARFLPSVQFQTEEFKDTLHFYPKDANRYLTNYLDSSLTRTSYRYCLFWRFLYENYKSGTTKDKLAIIREAYAATKPEADDAIEDGEDAMNSALSAGGGNFNAFDEAVDSFANANYWTKSYYSPDSLYKKPKITLSATFNGSKTTYQDSIPHPFGIDYLLFTFQYVDVKWAHLYFDGNPDNDGDKPDFHPILSVGQNGQFEKTEIKLDSEGKGFTDFWLNENDTAWLVITRVDSSQTMPDRNYKVTLSRPIAVTTPYWDNIQVVLNNLGPYYKYDNITDPYLANPDSILGHYSNIFANCSPYASSYAAGAANRIKKWVSESGYFYASDYAYEYIEAAFPTYIDFPTYPKIGVGNQYVTADIVDPGLAAYLNQNTIQLYYDLWSWVVVDNVSPQTKTYLYGTYEVYATEQGTGVVQHLLKSMEYQSRLKERQLGTKSGPLMVGFDYEDGYVIFTTFHNEPQQTEPEQKLIRYMVLRQTAGWLLAEAIAYLNSALYKVQEIIDAINQSETHIYKFKNYFRQLLQIILHWSGSEMKLTIYKPDGSPYGSWQYTSSPIIVEIPDADTGDWEYRITAIQVPFENYPLALVTGSETPNILLKGDTNRDGKITVSDVVYLINYLFKGGPAPSPLNLGDANCDSAVTVSDVIYLINYLFKGGPAPC